MSQVHQKTGLIDKKISDRTYRFIMSNEEIDRDGDIIKADGWDLKDFKKNPVALAYHDSTKVIGRWKNLQIKDSQLIGDLELAPDEVGSLQRAINKLVELGFIKAVSVGFRGISAEPIETGLKFIKQTLMECSLVAVPSNQSALSIAKSFNLEQPDIDNLFGQSSSEDSSKGDSAGSIENAKRAILNSNKLLRRK